MTTKTKSVKTTKKTTAKKPKILFEKSPRVMFFDMFKGKIIESEDCWD